MSEMSRLRWLCRRGMKEHDLLVNHYLDNHYQNAPVSDQQAFKFLLDLTDPELSDLILGRVESPDTDVNRVIKILRDSLSDQTPY